MTHKTLSALGDASLSGRWLKAALLVFSSVATVSRSG